MKTKKLVSLLTTCLLLVSLLTVMPASSAARNLFTHENVDFEKGTTAGWSGAKLGTWSDDISSEYSYSGDYSLKLMNEDADGAVATYNYNGGFDALTVGEKYVFSAMINIPTALTGTDGTVQLYVNAGGYNFGEKIGVTSGWQKTELEFTAAEAQTFYIRLRDKTAGTVYIDDIALYSVKELEAEAALRFGSTSDYVKGDGEYHWDMEGTLVNSENATDSSCVFYGGANSTAAMDHELSIVHGGGKSVKMTLTADNDSLGQQLRIRNNPSLVSGETYEASVWVNIPASEDITQVCLRINLGGSYSDKGQFVQTKLNLTSTNGKWVRVGLPFTMTAAASPSIYFMVSGSKDAVMYWDDLMIVKKQNQSPVLQLFTAVKDIDNHDFLIENTSLSKGAFTVKYDIHKTADDVDMTGKSLIAAIYKTVGGKKQLVEISIGTFAAEDTAVSLPMTGIAASENAADYSMKVMLWDSILGMQNLKRADISFS